MAIACVEFRNLVHRSVEVHGNRAIAEAADCSCATVWLIRDGANVPVKYIENVGVAIAKLNTARIRAAGIYCANAMWAACAPLPEWFERNYQPVGGDFEHLADVLGLSIEEIPSEAKRIFEDAYAHRQHEIEDGRA